jgi:hypothetical protein
MVLALLTIGSPASGVFASTPAEQVRCTSEPRSKWMTEEQIKKLFGVDQFAVVKFKVSRTNCYEFYAVTHNGQIIEAYYHPVSGKLVKETRIQPAAEPQSPPAVPNGKSR